MKIESYCNTNNLKSFLLANRVRKGQPFTHTSMFPQKCSYFIDDKKLNEFYEIYHKQIFVHKSNISLTEANREFTPVKIDLDFKWYDTKLVRKYTQQDIKQIISYYMEIIEEWYELTQDEKLCFVMEKKFPYTKRIEKQTGQKLVKDGVHIMFPFLVTRAESQFIFRQHVLSKIGNITSKFNLLNSDNDVLDESVIQKNNWMMYGSIKQGNTEPYLLTHIYQADSDVTKIQEQKNDYSTESLVRILSIRSHYENESLLKNDKVDYETLEYEKINSFQRKNKVNNKIINNVIRKLSNDELKNTKNLLSCLTVERASNRDSWIKVGWALRNSGTNPELLEYWKEFSRKAPEYQNEADDACEREWSNMEPRPDDVSKKLTKGSLWHWAKKDNPEKFDEYRYENSKASLEKALKMDKTNNKTIDEAFEKGLHIMPEDVAEILHDMYWGNFIMVNAKGKGRYYQFEECNHRWIEMDGQMLLREKIRTDVRENLLRYIQQICNKEIEGSSDTLESWMQDTKKLLKVMHQLKCTNFKNNVMEECKEHFRDRNNDFLKRLDENPNLLGFNNGIYDLKLSEFRDGEADDFVSMTTGLDYREYSWDSDDVSEVMEFLEQILPDYDVREYVLTLLGSFIHGSNKNEKFHIWTGSGGNGKSKLIELFEKAIGDYSCKLPISLLTSKRKASNEAQPELARTKGKRSAILQEPDEKTRINVGLMKEMTGNDTITARNLYENPIEFKPQIKMILICNHLPELPYDDEATWRRVRAVEFKSRFVDEEEWDKTDPYQFPKDESLSERFPKWKEPFMWILLQYQKKWRENGLREPNEVIECTEKYKAQNDHFADFYRAHIIKNTDSNELIPFKFIYSTYKKVVENNSEAPKKPKELQAYLEKKIGPIGGSGTKKGWVGYTLIVPDFEEQDSNQEENENDNNDLDQGIEA